MSNVNYEEKLEKLASGEIKGVRLNREAEWYAQTIATGFLFLGAVVREALGKTEPEEAQQSETARRGPGRPKGSRVNFSEPEETQNPVDDQDS